MPALAVAHVGTLGSLVLIGPAGSAGAYTSCIVLPGVSKRVSRCPTTSTFIESALACVFISVCIIESRFCLISSGVF